MYQIVTGIRKEKSIFVTFEDMMSVKKDHSVDQRNEEKTGISLLCNAAVRVLFEAVNSILYRDDQYTSLIKLSEQLFGYLFTAG